MIVSVPRRSWQPRHFLHFLARDDPGTDRGLAHVPGGAVRTGYTPDAQLSGRLAEVSSLVGGRVFSEGDLGAVQEAAQDFFGSGPTKARPFEGERLALMPYVTLAAFVPLAFLLWRRNL